MKKLTLVFLAGLTFATVANAQSLQFGIKAGANFANVNGDIPQGVSTSSLVGFNGGVFLGLGFTENLSLQPELVYSGQGFKESESGTTATQTENYLNIPVLLKYKLPVGLYFETGPQIGFIMSAKAKASGFSADDKSSFKSTDFAWAIGAGFQIPATQLGIDVRYNIGLANIVDDSGSGSGGSSGSLKNGVFQVGLTYALFNSGGK